MLSSAGMSGSALLIPNLLRDGFSADTVTIGFVTASFNASLFASSYYFGRYSDVHGRKLILRAGLALTAFSLFLLAFTDSTNSLWMIRVLVGLCAGMYPSALLAHVYESDRKVGKFSAYGALGFGFGVFFAGVISIYYGVFLFCALMLFGAFAITLTMPFGAEHRHHVPFFPRAIIKRNFPVYISIMFRHIGANMIWVIYPLFLEDLGAADWFIGSIYAINAFAQFVFMQYVDRFSSMKLVIFGFIFSIITFPSYTLATEAWQIIPAQISIAAAWSCLYVGSVKYVMERNDEKGTSAGLLQSSLSISAIIGAMIGGVSAFTLGYHGAMYIATVLATIGVIIFWFTHRLMGHSKEINST
ncbi:MAG: Major Facilitator Superfamily protein [Methanomassiliicoccales archaeon PtaU1.Bin124]|nr:MAG: Major Facilitator Superfamily protein [Methanomassiliicoccales archaeon PtaU1.Bin124]